jgi:N6-adenosine-specific RNA methylase IME4
VSDESPNIRYGRLQEAAHISGYSFERLCDELEWLLEGERWQTVGAGYGDVNDFIRSIDLSPFNLGETRKKLHQRIKELQPKASTRAIGAMTGVNQSTVVRDLSDDASASPEDGDTLETANGGDADDANASPAPAAPSGREAHQTVKKVKAKEQRQRKKRQERDAAAAAIAAEPPPLPEGPFRVIAVDPPWRYEGREDDHTHRAANPYPSMTVEEIMAVPVASRAHEDCVLWLWTTHAFMRQSYDVMEAWGFAPKVIVTWVKDRMGTGDYLRSQSEFCHLAVRGKPTLTLTNQTTVIHGPLREHSRKPDEFYALAEALCPGSKLECFQRAPRPGWAGHGNELQRFSQRQAGVLAGADGGEAGRG